jgi:hypothetical protein
MEGDALRSRFWSPTLHKDYIFPISTALFFFGNICKGTPLEPENRDFSLSSRGYKWFEIKLRIGAFERGRSDV